MYKVYGSKKSRSFRVLWALEEMGLEYEYIASAPRSDEIRAMNPSGKIPVLTVGDEVILDSVAIIQFLADKHGLLTFAAGTVARAHQDGFMQFACDEMDSVLWTAARNSFILPEDKRVPAIKPTLKWEYTRSMAVLAARLQEREYLMGETFTVADIVTAHCVTWGKTAGFELTEPAILAYVERATSRPAYLRAASL